MYCPSVADLSGPEANKSSRLGAAKRKSPSRLRMSPPRVANLNPPSPDLSPKVKKVKANKLSSRVSPPAALEKGHKTVTKR